MSEEPTTGWRAAMGEKNSTLRAVLVYEDFDMAVQSQSLCEVLARAGEGCEVQLSVWKYDFFLESELTQAAALQAEQADLVIFAARRSDRLPVAVEQWLESWPAGRRLQGGALVAVFPPAARQTAGASPVGSLLERAARRAGLDFFCEFSQATAQKLLSAAWAGGFGPAGLADGSRLPLSVE